MCQGCAEFLEQKRGVFTRAAILQVKQGWISHEEHKDIIQSAYVKVLERKSIDPSIVQKPDRYLTRLTKNLGVDELRRSTVTVGHDELNNPRRLPIEQGGFDDEALVRHEAIARDRYLTDYPDEQVRNEHTQRINELFLRLSSPQEKDLFLSLYNREPVQEYAARHEISFEAAKKRRKRFKEKLVKKFRGVRHG
jgi:RNA polymerase sigma factor (sigma-70 family)